MNSKSEISSNNIEIEDILDGLTLDNLSSFGKKSAKINSRKSNPIRGWSKLETITVENFKAIKSAIIPLGDVTILVGANGSGKSSVLQCVHWAARVASYIAPKSTSEMLGFDRIDYLPSSEPVKMAYLSELKTEIKTTPTSVIFTHRQISDETETAAAKVKIFAARNKGGVTAYIEGGGAVTPFKQRDTFITAYIPGLAGLSERETVLAQPQLRRQAASGDAGSVLRNVLYNLSIKNLNEQDDVQAKQRLKRLNALVCEVHPNLEITVSFDDREDYNISASYVFANMEAQWRSLETLATGVLQVIQIFAYLILFKPKILLIDEPDAHLHPDKQERLIEALERASEEFDTQIILTTHSSHMVRAASDDTKIVWMHEGAVKSGKQRDIARLLGWGALDKAALFFIEDENDEALRAILRQWPKIDKKIAVCRCFGLDNLPKDVFLKGLLGDTGLIARAIIHRDSDFMTEEEKGKWKALYNTDGTYPWVTAESDVEAYFCTREYLVSLYIIEATVADGWIEEAVNSFEGNKIYKTFVEKREKINRLLWVKEGGGFPSKNLWENNGCLSAKNIKGKDLHKALTKVIQSKKGYDSKLFKRYTIPKGFEIAPDLRETIQNAIYNR